MDGKWFENNRFLWWFAGEDSYILSQCKAETKKKFSAIGLLVIIILVFSAAGITYGVYELLESYYIGLILGIYFAILILFLYLFILYTLTKDVLPPKAKSKYGRYSSRAIRIGFLVFLGLLVSQPLEYELFSNMVNSQLNDSIIKEIENRNAKLNKEYVLKLNDRKSENLDANTLEIYVERYSAQKAIRLDNFVNYQYSRNFFIRKLILMDTSLETSFIWIFSMLFIVLFITPVYLKLKVKTNSNYYILKKKIQYKIVQDHHSAFVNSYNEILQRKFPELQLKWTSKYIDAPFNSKQDSKLVVKEDTDFNKWLLNEGI